MRWRADGGPLTLFPTELVTDNGTVLAGLCEGVARRSGLPDTFVDWMRGDCVWANSLVDRIDAYLGHPDADPHGDPIPSAEGTMRRHAETALALSECQSNAAFKVTRVLSQDTDFLRYLTEQGVGLETSGNVKSNDPAASIIHLQIEGRTVSLSHSVAENILVEVNELTSPK